VNAAKSTSEASITEFLSSRIEAGDFPSAVYLIAENGKTIFDDALGDAVREPEPHPATPENNLRSCIFNQASNHRLALRSVS
jgi:hypothetical protein